MVVVRNSMDGGGGGGECYRVFCWVMECCTSCIIHPFMTTVPRVHANLSKPPTHRPTHSGLGNATPTLPTPFQMDRMFRAKYIAQLNLSHAVFQPGNYGKRLGTLIYTASCLFFSPLFPLSFFLHLVSSDESKRPWPSSPTFFLLITVYSHSRIHTQS